MNFLTEYPELSVLILSMFPIAELRGAIPLALLKFNFPFWKAYILGVIGNLIPIYPLLILLEPLSNLFSRTKPGRIFFNWLFERTRRRGKIVEKYEALGLLIFVAMPLPFTGAWTGAVAASLFRIDKSKSILIITLGVGVAGAIVTSLVLLGCIGALIVGGILLYFAVRFLLKKI